MADEIDFSAAAEKVRELFGSDEGRTQIKDILSMFGGGSSSDNEEEKRAEEEGRSDFNFDADSIEMMMKVQQIMSAVNNAETTRQAAFLKSLGPLLSSGKREKVNNAVKFLSIGKAIDAFRKM